MSQQKGGSFVRDKLAGDVLVSPHSCYRYVRGRELLLLFERILVISREKLFRLTSITLGTLHLRATSLSLSCFHFPDEEKRKAKERGRKEERRVVLFVLCPKIRAKASIRCFPNDPNSGYETALRRKGQEKGEVHLFCEFLSRRAASSQRIPRAGEYEWREEGHRAAHFVISVGREGVWGAVWKKRKKRKEEGRAREFESLDTLSALEPEARLAEREGEGRGKAEQGGQEGIKGREGENSVTAPR